MMHILHYILLIFLLICALAATFSRSLLNTVLVFMSFSLIMSIIWILLESPDLAITEAAVGAGITTLLFVLALKKINGILREEKTMPKEEADSADGHLAKDETSSKEEEQA